MNEILENEFVRETLSEIGSNQNERLMSCHGLSHAINVANFSSELCKMLSLSDKEAVIASLVHDIGMIGEKENHALRSYELLKQHTNVSEKVLQAVKNHSFLEEIYSYEGAVLAICDKIDLDKSRLLPLGLEDGFHSRILGNIDRTVLTAEGNTIVINYETSGPCDLYLYEKYFKILEKGFAYLDVNYDVRINNISMLGK